VKLTEVI